MITRHTPPLSISESSATNILCKYNKLCTKSTTIERMYNIQYMLYTSQHISILAWSYQNAKRKPDAMERGADRNTGA